MLLKDGASVNFSLTSSPDPNVDGDSIIKKIQKKLSIPKKHMEENFIPDLAKELTDDVLEKEWFRM